MPEVPAAELTCGTEGLRAAREAAGKLCVLRGPATCPGHAAPGLQPCAQIPEDPCGWELYWQLAARYLVPCWLPLAKLLSRELVSLLPQKR